MLTYCQGGKLPATIRRLCVVGIDDTLASLVKRVLKVQSKQLLDGKSPLSVFRYSSEETVDIPFKKGDERSRFIERLDSADDAFSYTGWDLDEKPAFHSIGTERIEPEPPGLLETIRSFLEKG